MPPLPAAPPVPPLAVAPPAPRPPIPEPPVPPLPPVLAPPRPPDAAATRARAAARASGGPACRPLRSCRRFRSWRARRRCQLSSFRPAGAAPAGSVQRATRTGAGAGLGATTTRERQRRRDSSPREGGARSQEGNDDLPNKRRMLTDSDPRRIPHPDRCNGDGPGARRSTTTRLRIQYARRRWAARKTQSRLGRRGAPQARCRSPRLPGSGQAVPVE